MKMKKFSKIVLGSFLAAGAVGLAGCNTTTEESTTGTVTVTESVKALAGVSVDESGNLIVSYTDGTTENLGKVQGEDGEAGTAGLDGKDGTSITRAELNENGELILTYSDGTTVNIGVIKGADGKDFVKTVYTITLVNGDETETISVTEGSLPELPLLTMEGYDFLGWYTEDGKKAGTAGVYSDMTLTARFEEAKDCTITINGTEYSCKSSDFLADVCDVTGYVYQEMGENLYYINPYTTKAGELDSEVNYYIMDSSYYSYPAEVVAQRMFMMAYGLDDADSETKEYYLGIIADYIGEMDGDTALYNAIHERSYSESYQEYLEKLERRLYSAANASYASFYTYVYSTLNISRVKDDFDPENIGDVLDDFGHYYDTGSLVPLITEESLDYLKDYFTTDLDLEDLSIKDMMDLAEKDNDYFTILKNLYLTDEAKKVFEGVFDSSSNFEKFLDVNNLDSLYAPYSETFFMMRNRYYSGMEFNTLYDAEMNIRTMSEASYWYSYFMRLCLTINQGVANYADSSECYYYAEITNNAGNIFTEYLEESYMEYLDTLVNEGLYAKACEKSTSYGRYAMEAPLEALRSAAELMAEYANSSIDILHENRLTEKLEDYLLGMGVGVHAYMDKCYASLLEMFRGESSSSSMDYDDVEDYIQEYYDSVTSYMSARYGSMKIYSEDSPSEVFVYEEKYGIFAVFTETEDGVYTYSSIYDDVSRGGLCYTIDTVNKTFIPDETDYYNDLYVTVSADEYDTFMSASENAFIAHETGITDIMTVVGREPVYDEAGENITAWNVYLETERTVSRYSDTLWMNCYYGKYMKLLTEDGKITGYVLPDEDRYYSAEIAEESLYGYGLYNYAAILNAEGTYDVYWVASDYLSYYGAYSFDMIAAGCGEASLVKDLYFGYYNEEGKVVITSASETQVKFKEFCDSLDVPGYTDTEDSEASNITAYDSESGLYIYFYRAENAATGEYVYIPYYFYYYQPFGKTLYYVDRENMTLDPYLPYAAYKMSFAAEGEVSAKVYCAAGDGYFAVYELNAAGDTYEFSSFADDFDPDTETHISLDTEDGTFEVLERSSENTLQLKYNGEYEAEKGGCSCNEILVQLPEGNAIFHKSVTGKYTFGSLYTDDFDETTFLSTTNMCIGELTEDGKLQVTNHCDSDVFNTYYYKNFETELTCPEIYITALGFSSAYRFKAFKYTLLDGKYIYSDMESELPSDACMGKIEDGKIVLDEHSDSHFEELYIISSKESEETCSEIVVHYEGDYTLTKNYILYTYNLETGNYDFTSYFDTDNEDLSDYCQGSYSEDFSSILLSSHEIDHGMKLKYDREVTCEEKCSVIAVYDEEYEVYAIYQYNSEEGKYSYFCYDDITDASTCVCTLNDETGVLTPVTHTAFHSMLLKYDHEVTTSESCPKIAVYDETYKLYAVFEYAGGIFRYSTCIASMPSDACLGTFDSELKVLSVAAGDHTLSEILKNTYDKSFTSDVTYTNLYVEIPDYDLYAKYTYDTDTLTYKYTETVAKSTYDYMTMNLAEIDGTTLKVTVGSIADLYQNKTFTLSVSNENLYVRAELYDANLKKYVRFTSTYDSETGIRTYTYSNIYDEPWGSYYTPVEISGSTFTVLADCAYDYAYKLNYITYASEETCQYIEVLYRDYFRPEQGECFVFKYKSGVYSLTSYGGSMGTYCEGYVNDSDELVVTIHRDSDADLTTMFSGDFQVTGTSGQFIEQNIRARIAAGETASDVTSDTANQIAVSIGGGRYVIYSYNATTEKWNLDTTAGVTVTYTPEVEGKSYASIYSVADLNRTAGTLSVTKLNGTYDSTGESYYTSCYFALSNTLAAGVSPVTDLCVTDTVNNKNYEMEYENGYYHYDPSISYDGLVCATIADNKVCYSDNYADFVNGLSTVKMVMNTASISHNGSAFLVLYYEGFYFNLDKGSVTSNADYTEYTLDSSLVSKDISVMTTIGLPDPCCVTLDTSSYVLIGGVSYREFKDHTEGNNECKTDRLAEEFLDALAASGKDVNGSYIKMKQDDVVYTYTDVTDDDGTSYRIYFKITLLADYYSVPYTDTNWTFEKVEWNDIPSGTVYDLYYAGPLIIANDGSITK